MTPRALLVLSVIAFGVSMPAQAQDLIAPEYLAARYTAAADGPSMVTVAGQDEPGERLTVTGRTLDGSKPVAGVSLYVFHTDIHGRYATDITDLNAAELNPRLHGSLRSDATGRYQFETIRPGSYDNGPAHVHYVVKAAGFKPLLLSLQFDDDPIVVARRKFGIPLLDPESFKNGPCKSRPDCVLTRPVSRDAHGVWQVTRDIQMVRE
jgi:protocatechuate 3,4-dioxygenase beta subunit